MSDNFIPNKFYLLQVYDKHDNTWSNGYSNSHVDGLYLDKKTARRAATSYLGEGRNCRIIEFSKSTTQIDVLDSSKTIDRKIKRYLNSELKFIKKYKDCDTDLASFSFLDLSKIKTSDQKVQDLLNTAKKHHVNYGIILKLKYITDVNTREHLFFTIDTHENFDNLHYYLWTQVLHDYRYNNYKDEKEKLSNILMRKNFAYNMYLSDSDSSFVEVDDTFINLNKQAIL